jgi:hypothetical protein
MVPFVGLRPFREDERHLFMGRELASEYVETKSALNPLTLLFARSGVGKSSFLTSRLIPQLREEHKVAYINEWGGKKPEVAIREALNMLDSFPNEPGQKIYLVLDQFEDVFKRNFDRRDLWDTLAEIVNSDQTHIRTIISMREEWLGAWEEVEQYIPNAFISLVRLAPLTKKELRRAIIRPVEIEGTVQIEQRIADVLLQDLSRPNAYGLGEGFVQPGLLQVVCLRLWEEAARTACRIDEALYNRLGGADAIVREVVWKHLRRASSAADVFTTDQRVLWAGLVRHLSVAPGVKALVTPKMLGQKLLMSDLGLAGAATATGKSLSVWRYLNNRSKRREAAPEPLLIWISETLEKARTFGFLKRQEYSQGQSSQSQLYELSHDGLDEILREFSLEFEKWVARRVYALLAILFVIVFLLPYFCIVAFNQGLAAALNVFLITVAVGALYAGVIWVISKLIVYVAAVTYYPIVRRVVGGSIEPKLPPSSKIN